MRGRLVEDRDGSRPVDTNVFTLHNHYYRIFVFVFLSCEGERKER
jgi:hypothetical protein